MKTLKRLFWDLEVSPDIVLSWRVGHKVSIGPENIIKERAIICIGYKWEQDKKARVLVWDDKQDDKEILRQFINLANEADELIAHNGDKFDMPWFMTRCLFHRLPTFPVYKTADTLQWAKRRFYFNSNKLNYIAQFLGMGAKLKTDFGMWREITLNNDRSALKKMAIYCARDVELLQNVWQKLAPLSAIKSHAGVMANRDNWSCPACASEHVKKNLSRISACGTTSHQMKCNDCGRYYAISQSVFDRYQKAKKD